MLLRPNLRIGCGALGLHLCPAESFVNHVGAREYEIALDEESGAHRQIVNGFTGARALRGRANMDQHQGSIIDEKGQPILNLHVSLRVHGAHWKGVIESSMPVSADAHPEQNKFYRLRLDDGQQKTIHIGSVTLVHLKNGESFRATFDSSGPPPPSQAKAE